MTYAILSKQPNGDVKVATSHGFSTKKSAMKFLKKYQKKFPRGNYLIKKI